MEASWQSTMWEMVQIAPIKIVTSEFWGWSIIGFLQPPTKSTSAPFLAEISDFCETIHSIF
jgi:hypothetical protein